MIWFSIGLPISAEFFPPDCSKAVNPKGIASQSPRLRGFCELPWVRPTEENQPQRGCAGPRICSAVWQATSRIRKQKRPTEKFSRPCFKNWEEDYFFSSALGLHFVQVLPSFLASTQHLWLQSLPLALAFSQQDCFLPSSFLPSSATTVPTTNVNAQTAINNDLMSFINLLSLPVFKKFRGVCRFHHHRVPNGDSADGVVLVGANGRKLQSHPRFVDIVLDRADAA